MNLKAVFYLVLGTLACVHMYMNLGSSLDTLVGMIGIAIAIEFWDT